MVDPKTLMNAREICQERQRLEKIGEWNKETFRVLVARMLDLYPNAPELLMGLLRGSPREWRSDRPYVEPKVILSF